MRALIIINHFQTGKALERYLRYLHNYNTTMINFSQLLNDGISPHLLYDIIISDVYDDSNDNLINYGLQYGDLFEAKNKEMIYFFTKVCFRESYSCQDLPDNSFYIPCQLKKFTDYIAKKDKVITSTSKKMMLILNSNPLTSSHI